jgi:2-polyprenyl-3-methyl-5-hydroxy-6-metoxy-1,4-benzoquinol methylase
MRRSFAPEIMDDLSTPEEDWEKFHHQLGLIHWVLGNESTILDALRRDPRPIQRVLDIGCGNGELLGKIRRTLAVDVVGVELRAPKSKASGIPIVEADATHDRLPAADVAICLAVVHHLSEEEMVALIRNAARSVRRLIILDLVRHWLPLALFRIFLCPFLHWTVAVDGLQSVRRAYTPPELEAIVKRALAGSSARFEQTVTPLRSRQMVDILWS